MCTETFLRLPEEKKNRILEAAWAEFTAAPFAEVSINAIIRRAGIPRGSFYQYFNDKTDLFAYLLENVREQFVAGYHRLLISAEGDLFRLPLLTYDQLMERADSDADSPLNRFLRILRINPGIDLEKLLLPLPEQQLRGGECWAGVDTSRLRRQDPDFLCRLLSMLLMALGSVLMYSLSHPGQGEACRRELAERIEMIQYGCAVRPEQAG